ncbi:hypothetical protein J2X37_003209 [Croceicoccus sp. BE223]|nr:hypothetical protein [Croceicoccus sp. BE223]
MSLAEIAQAVAARNLPPVATWNPAESGDSAMRIARDGRWYHDGSEITRAAMVRAFSGLLRRDDDGFWLVVPYQKLSIEVEDAPFVATDVRADNDGGEQVLTFRLNTDEFVTADADHPVTIRGSAEEPAAYITVRDRLEARLDRSTWLQLVEIALAEGTDPPGVTSRGTRFGITSG